MRILSQALAALVVLALAGSCGGGSSPATPSTPAPTPTPTPEPAGTARYLGSTLPEGSTVEVEPMHTFGQQATNLRFAAEVNLREGLASGLVQAFVRTEEHRCMGGGGTYTFPAGMDVPVMPFSVSHQANPPPPCQLPYTTTHVEFVVTSNSTHEQVLAAAFPVVYHFVAKP